jgi:hypothetical protein
MTQDLLPFSPGFPGVFSRCSQDWQDKERVRDSGSENEMKAALYAQLNPVKTMQQLIGDRRVLRIGILAGLMIAACC